MNISYDNIYDIDVVKFVNENCTNYYQGVYGSFNFFIGMIIIYSIMLYLNDYLKLGKIKFEEKRVNRFFKIDAYDGSIFLIIANISLKAIFIRIIQLWLNLKFQYGVI